MERQSLDSPDILSVGYDAEVSILEIKFTSGSTYQYLDVPAELYDGLLAANSPGRYFEQYIRNKFKFFEID